MERPIIGVTIGDPAGIGPEIVLKALSNLELYKLCKPLIIGDLKLLQQISKQLSLNLSFNVLVHPREAKGEAGTIEVLNIKNVDLMTLQIGKIAQEAGKAAVEYIENAVKYALAGEIDAIATAPINKESIRLAGSRHIGHTELIADLSGSNEPLTMFWVRGVRIFFLTRHLSLRKAIDEIKNSKIVRTVFVIDKLLKDIGIRKPRIAVAALNPHASDGGLVGDEEEVELIPAVKELQLKGINVIGPVPADSVFHQAFSGKYDAVLSLYHDQGHIAAKTVDFYGTVSATLGLPFIRTSVDHGTAFDIAGKGIADSKSMEEAIKAAVDLLSPKRKRK
ncbi:MAG: 4-phospho-D-threonate 3-dehydrogenase / 4-phospho-D-erythronate 3-dehydrogenase [Thermoproteota archaeon]|nr:4-phospho-D-threonate 3-dehydrogenase / 4-phospho-D-erythronate 3-dehydrogenase [Thermoproteota archaeon]